MNENHDPIYHGPSEADLVAAIERARKIKGYVTLSVPPDAPHTLSEVGYWSDTQGFCRNWEHQVYRHGQQVSLAVKRELKRRSRERGAP